MILSGITKKYGETKALDGVTCEIAEGKITAVLGESGAGKSTLLSVISGLISYEGEIDGVSGAHVRRRERCAYLFQDPKLLPNLTVEENLRFVLPKERWNAIGAMLARVKLDGKEMRRPGALSGGERQRVAIARAFLFPHELLLMDEPFSSLDLALKKSLIELVQSLWEEQKNTVVFVTHDVREASLLSHRALVLKRGKIVLSLAAERPFPRDFFTSSPEEERLVRSLTEGEE